MTILGVMVLLYTAIGMMFTWPIIPDLMASQPYASHREIILAAYIKVFSWPFWIGRNVR